MQLNELLCADGTFNHSSQGIEYCRSFPRTSSSPYSTTILIFKVVTSFFIAFTKWYAQVRHNSPVWLLFFLYLLVLLLLLLPLLPLSLLWKSLSISSLSSNLFVDDTGSIQRWETRNLFIVGAKTSKARLSANLGWSLRFRIKVHAGNLHLPTSQSDPVLIRGLAGNRSTLLRGQEKRTSWRDYLQSWGQS